MGRIIKFDVRDMEPPQPLLNISKALEELREEDELEVIGSRPFVHLIPRLEELGFEHELKEISEGYLLRIKLRTAPSER